MGALSCWVELCVLFPSMCQHTGCHSVSLLTGGTSNCLYWRCQIVNKPDIRPGTAIVICALNIVARPIRSFQSITSFILVACACKRICGRYCKFVCGLIAHNANVWFDLDDLSYKADSCTLQQLRYDVLHHSLKLALLQRLGRVGISGRAVCRYSTWQSKSFWLAPISPSPAIAASSARVIVLLAVRPWQLMATETCWSEW